MATFTVSNLLDSGAGSLRQAVTDANLTAGVDNIDFTVSGTIVLTSGEIAITQDVVINGDTDADGVADITVSGNNNGRVFSISGTGTDVELHSLTLADGLSSGDGGAINLSAGNTLDVVNSTFRDNETDGAGGAIRSAGDLTLLSSTFTANTAETGGGAVSQSAGTLELINTTVSNNQVNVGAGGGIAVAASVTSASIANSTITLNHSNFDVPTAIGGGLSSSTSALTISNSVVAANISGSSPVSNDVDGTVQIAQNSFFGTSVTITTNTASTVNGGNPMLGALQDNGGPVETHMILVGSPLIGAGDAAFLPADTFDLDGDFDLVEDLPIGANGQSRVVGMLDIGAVEFDDFGQSVTTAGAVTVGTMATGEIEAENDEDWFAVNFESGVTYVIDLQGFDSGLGTLDDPFLKGIYDASGLLIAGTNDDNSGSGFDSQVSYEATTTGTHYIAAASSAAELGTYTLSVAAESVALFSGGFATIEEYTSIAAAVADAVDDDSIFVNVDLYTAGPETITTSVNGLEINFNPGVDVPAPSFILDGLTALELTVTGHNAVSMTGNGANNILKSGDGNDTLAGEDSNDLLEGGFGDDSLFGGNDNDILRGDGGKDNLRGDAGNDVLSGGGDNDILNGGIGTDVLFGGAGNDLLFGGDGFDKIYGGDGFDRIFGGSENDIANGGGDNDIINTGSGNDLVFAQNGNDLVFLQAGNDKVFGGDGNDKVFGGLGNDTMNLGDGNDEAFGGAGMDNITGAGGNDILSGGGDADTFVFAANQGNDRITDLTGIDIIDISAFGVTNGVGSDQDWRDATVSVGTSGGGSNVTIGWDGGGTLTLENTTIASLTDLNFFF